jgi:multiple sugar transport system permease protein
LLILGALLAIFPMLWMLSASLMPTGEASTYPPHLIPSRITFSHYGELFTRLNLGRYLLNSTLIAVTVTAVSLVVNSMAGYAFAKLRFRGRDRTFRLLSLGLVLPVQVAMLPLFLLMKNLHLINTYWGVIIPGMASIFGIFLIRQYALSIPDDMLDAAGNPVTKHSLNPVPLLAMGRAVEGRSLDDGVLADVAPTILELAALRPWAGMTGRSLLRPS